MNSQQNRICGIYKITNITNNKCYIGQSISCIQRLYEHKSLLKYNKHSNKHLQTAFNKSKKIKFEVFFLCNIQDLDSHEIYFINFYNSNNRSYGYNIETGGTNSNKIIPIETRIKQSNLAKNRQYSSTTRQRISKSLTGRKLTQETKNKMSLAKINCVRSIEHCNNISNALIKNPPIIQIDLQDNVIRIWKSIGQIHRETGINQANIWMICKGRGRAKTAGGYKWKYSI